MAGVYFHIPYCVRKCAYCDFVSYPEPERVGAYVCLLKKEIELRARLQPGPERIDTVFFGGGTPSLLTGEALAGVLDTLRAFYAVAPDAEITLECNPGTCSFEKLKAYRAAGADRLSIGLQSASDALLARIGRIHTYERFLETLQAAREAGFENISVDVMHGLPGQTGETYLDTLQKVCGLDGITHISAYSLILEEGTPLYAKVERGEETLPDEDAVADMQDAGMAYLESREFLRYEISNFAKPGYACRHNLNYWNNGEYAAFGVAAHGARCTEKGRIRYENVRDPARYEALLLRGELPTAQSRVIPLKEERFESVMLALRKVEGLSSKEFFDRFGFLPEEVWPETVRALLEQGLLADVPGSLRLNARGLDLQNEALVLFMEEDERRSAAKEETLHSGTQRGAGPV